MKEINDRIRQFLGVVLIVLLTIIAYFPALRSGFIWDDDLHVTANETLKTVSGLERIWLEPGSTVQYYPVVFSSFWVDYQLWGLHPFGYHLVNVLLHAANAVLLWWALRILGVPNSWWAAAIFAVHPVAVESVAWIAERKNVLSGLFSLLSLLAYLRLRPLSTGNQSVAWDWRCYLAFFLLFLFAVLSKTVTCTLPVVLLLLVWWKKGRIEKRDVIPLLPLFIVGALLGLLAVHLEKRAGAQGADWTLSFGQRCLLAGRALWFYAGKLVWPRELTFVYPRWKTDVTLWWQYLFPLGALAVIFVLWNRRLRLGRGPLTGVLCFVVTLSPALGFFNVFPFRYSYVADHFQYLACVGLIALIVNWGAFVWRRAVSGTQHLGVLLGAGVLVVAGTATWNQCLIYQNPETLWLDTLAKNPSAWMAHNNLGTVFVKSGRFQDAMEQFREAVRIKPDAGEARVNLVSSLIRQGKVEEAAKQLEQWLVIKPDDAEARDNLGVALMRLGKVEEAIGQYRQALQLKPDYAQTHCDLGYALLRLGKVEEAARQLEQWLVIKPDDAEAHDNLGVALLRLGKVEEAIGQYQQALRLKPDYAEAHYNLGLTLSRVGKIQGAINHYEQALRFKPDYVEAQYHLALAFSQVGRFQEATACFEQALRIKPNDYRTQNDLAWLLATLPPSEGGNPCRAVSLAEQACELTDRRMSAYVDTLAAAYAADSQFGDAITTGQEAIELARSAGLSQVIAELEARLQLYRSGLAYRRPPALEHPSAPAGTEENTLRD